MGTPGKARASISHPAESGHGSLINPLVGVTARVRYLYAFRNSAAVSGERKTEGTRRPHSQQDHDIIKTRTVDNHSLEKRRTWCANSSFSPDITTILQASPSSKIHCHSRPASAVGILHGSFLDLPFLQHHGFSLGSALFRRSYSISSDSSSATSLFTDDTTITTIMTPSKEKQPLPSIKAAVIPHDHLVSFTEWRAALEEVRVLCLRRHWKSCITRCEKLLEDNHDNPHPMHECYIHFFHALSHELLARSMPDLSAAKIPHLESSKKSYLSASSSLLLSSQRLKDREAEEQDLEEEFFMSGNTSPMSTPTPTPRRPQTIAGLQVSKHLPSPSWISSSLNWVSASQASLANDPAFGSPLRKPLPLRIAPIWLSSSQASLANDPDFGSPLRKPAPLRVVKRVSMLATPPQEHDAHQSPPCTPLSTTSYQSRTPATVTFSECTTTWLQDRATQRYSAHAADFEPMLLRHVEVVDILMKSTMEVQANRHTAKASASSIDDGQTRAADRQARIEKLKANGWKRERFRPERYQDLCARALAEL